MTLLSRQDFSHEAQITESDWKDYIADIPF